MTVEIIGCYEENPLTFVGRCAGVSTDKMDKGDLVKRAKRCFEEGHLSVFEHLKLTWVVSDVSRALTHQLVRHRHCAFTQESQRYTEVDTAKQDWYIVPESATLTPEQQEQYEQIMVWAATGYQHLLDAGIPKEDARMVLPNACKTKIVVSMNMAEFFHFYRLRNNEGAQWEICYLAQDMLKSMFDLSDEWAELGQLMYEKIFGPTPQP